MSTLKLDTLSNKAGTASVPSDTIVSGTAKAWVNFDGTGTVAIRRAFNVSSITDNGTGDYTLNFTNATTDANYSIIVTGDQTTTSGGSGAQYMLGVARNGTMTTSAVQIYSKYCRPDNSGYYDNASIFVAIFS